MHPGRESKLAAGPAQVNKYEEILPEPTGTTHRTVYVNLTEQ